MDPYLMDEDELFAAGPTSPDPIEVLHPIDGFNKYGELLVVHSNFSNDRKWRYTNHPNQNNSGIQNHFQGLQRLYHDGYVAISGSNWRDKRSEILLYELVSKQKSNPWLSNVALEKKPPLDDSLHYTIQLYKPPIRPDNKPIRDRILWHGGGMDTLEHILAIPIEHTPNPDLKRGAKIDVPDHPDNSAVRFLDLSDLSKPKLHTNGITRDNSRAGAVGLTRLPSKFYLCGVWSDADKKPKKTRLDLYLSLNKTFNGKFRHGSAIRTIDEYFDIDNKSVPFDQAYQAINFIKTPNEYLMVGFYIKGKDHLLDLFKLNIQNPDTIPNSKDEGIGPCSLQLIHSVNFKCRKKYCSFRAASGSFTDSLGNLILYSGDEWKRSEKIYFSEFRRPLIRPKRLTLGTSWIEFYSKAELKGLTFTIVDLSNNRGNIQNFKKVYAREKDFGDKSWSIRYCLPNGIKYRLFEDHDYKKPLHTLDGTGKVEIVSLKALGYHKKLSSAKIIT